MMFTPALKAALTGLLAILPSPYLYCKSGGWGLDTACPRLVNTVDSFTHSTLTATHRLVPRWYDDPPDPITQQILQLKQDARKWSMTTDLIVAPMNSFELAQWSTDLIVRPPGDIIVWAPPSDFLAVLRSLVPSTPAIHYTTDLIVRPPAGDITVWVPSSVLHATLRSLVPTPTIVEPSASVTRTVPERITYNGQLRHTVMAFHALVIGFIAAAAVILAPAVRCAWSIVAGYPPALLAALGQVGRSIIRSLVSHMLPSPPPLTDTSCQLFVSSPTVEDIQHIFGSAEATCVPIRPIFAIPHIIRDHALMAFPRTAHALDLANWIPEPKHELRSLLVIFRDGPYPMPLALKRSTSRPRTFSAMTFREAKPAPTGGRLTMAVLVEEVSCCIMHLPVLVTHKASQDHYRRQRTVEGAKRTLRRQAPSIKLFGLWKRRLDRHRELAALRDEMGVDTALRHAQEGYAILRANLRSMMGIGEQVS